MRLISLDLRRLLTSILLLGAVVSASESTLPDVCFDSTPSVQEGVTGSALWAADLPASDAAGHGHQHACHCAHLHIAGLPAEGEVLAMVPSVVGNLTSYTPEQGILSTAPPHQPPRA